MADDAPETLLPVELRRGACPGRRLTPCAVRTCSWVIRRRILCWLDVSDTMDGDRMESTSASDTATDMMEDMDPRRTAADPAAELRRR